MKRTMRATTVRAVLIGLEGAMNNIAAANNPPLVTTARRRE
ncbi:MAG: hypothetical protein BWX98_02668 [Candidatus Aminicenantes bacterium ADurb.Bin147]|nr:MAG: hypothetical protein BWX98_02668 [Candidatus Aminicenantes bacterium ADurb.Bin147]